MNYEDYCSYELSKKLKEKGFDWECHSFYLPPNKSRKEEFFSGYQARIIRNQTHAFHYAAPTLYKAQKWLREEHHIHVSADINCLHKWFAKAISLESNDDLIWDGLMFPTYEQALSAGITKALELI